MATTRKKKGASLKSSNVPLAVSATPDDLLLAALERGDETMQTGRYLITYKESAVDQGIKSLREQGLRMADARDFKDQAISLEDVGDADAVTFPEIGVTLVSGSEVQSRGLTSMEEVSADSAIEAIEPEYFVFPDSAEYLRGFVSAAQTIAKDLGSDKELSEDEEEFDAQVLGATWGLSRCKVPPSSRSGLNIRVAILDTGMDLRHPDFRGRTFVTRSFVGQPV